jgi:thioredoxin-related protein
MIETIKKNIKNLKKLKAILKEKINKVDIQLQNEKTKFETNKLRHLKSKKSFFKSN